MWAHEFPCESQFDNVCESIEFIILSASEQQERREGGERKRESGSKRGA